MSFALKGRVLENDSRFTIKEDYTMFKRFPIALVTVIALGLGSQTATASTALELQTAKQEVPGTRDVEAGNFSAGIVKLERAVSRANHALDRAPALVNLCVALTASENFERATDVCNAAVDNGVSLDLAYNNRAVLRFMQGDEQGALADLEKAALLKPGAKVVKRNLDRARMRVQPQVVSN